MRLKGKRLLSLVLALGMVFSMLPTMALAGDSGETEVYTKVTSAPEDWSGTYLIVSEGDSLIMDGSLDKLDAEGNKVDVTITDGTITGAYAGKAFTIAAMEGGYSVKSASGYYISGQSGKNKLNTSTSEQLNTIDFADGNVKIVSNSTTLQYNNAATNGTRFRYYKSENQQPISLYKLAESTEPARQSGIVTDLTALQDGDSVVVFNPAYNKALSSTYQGYYNKGSDVTLTDGVLTYAETDVWTLGINEDGSYSFSVEGGKLAMNDSYASTPLNGTNPNWKLTAVEGKDGFFYVENTVRSGYLLEYQESYGTWSAYNNNTTGDAFQQQLYLVIEEGEEPTDPTDPVDPVEPTGNVYTLTDSIAQGDTVVMYNAGSGTVLTSVASGYKLAGASVTAEEDTITTEDTTAAWVVGKDASGNFTFTQGDLMLGVVKSGSYVNLSTNASDGYTAWTLESSSTANVFYVKNTNMPAGSYGPYYVEYYSGYTAYASSSPSDNAFGISFYKLESGEEPEPAPTYNTIAEALAGENGTEFTVKGVVTLVDGKNIYVQDATGGIDLYFGTAPSDIALGDTIIGTGKRATYSGLPELTGASYEKSEGLTLKAKDITIDALTNGDICTYVKLTNVEVTEVYDSNGTYTAPNITVTDGENSIQLYKAVINKDESGAWEYKVGDKLDITAAVGYYNKFQLRNTLASEVKLHVEAETGKVTSAEQLTDGTYVMVVSTGYAPLVYDNAWLSVVQPTIEGDKVTASQGAVWTLKVTDNTVTLTDKNGVTIAPKGGNNNGLSSKSYNWEWSFDEANQTFRFKGTGSDTVTLASNNTTTGDYPGNNRFRGYKNTTVASQGYPADFTLYKVDPESANDPVTPDAGLPKAGDKVVIYNQNAKAVLAEQNDNTDSPAINKALATITDGVATEVENGGVVFTVETDGTYYRFKNERYGYLCSNGTGNNAFYSKDFTEEGVSSEDADWLVRTCSGSVGGYELESRTAKYNGTYSQWLEYYSDSFKTYSMYKVTDYTIYSFFFYPLADGIKTQEDVVNDPKVVVTSENSVMLGSDYELTFYLDDINVYGPEEVTVKVEGSKEYAAAQVEGETNSFRATLPASEFAGKTSVDVTVSAVTGMYSTVFTITVVDEPSIGAVTPAANSQTGENKRPVIAAEIINAGENPVVTMTVNGSAVTAVYDGSKVTYDPSEDLADGRTTVTVHVKRADGKETSKSWSFTVGESQYQLYFGQLHSHTQYSDGSGTLVAALDYVKNLPSSANVQFVAFTDHSNYFDGSKTSAGTANPEGALYDMSLASSDSQKLWNEYNKAVSDFNEENAGEMVAIAGFEMTWSGGPGHINTFNTPGIVSRNNSTLNNKTSDAGMKAYYALLSQEEGIDSISQFNHPGSTFGTFSDFSYWDAVIDSRMYLVEVGNGEGAIHQGGYYPSYEYYTMALDKGWHLAPTNNQDNHKGKWGNANDARDVILTDDFTEEGIYDAIRNYRLYATEDKNLEITYTVNDLQMGTIIKTEDVPEKLNFNVTVYDPDSSDSIAKVELVVNSGKVAYTWDDPAELASGELTASLDPTYSYYYVRVTQGDGDLAVTAPVWVGESLKLGISSVECGTSTPVTDEKLTLTTTLFNSEGSEAAIKSVSYTANGAELEGTKSGATVVPASGTATITFDYIPTAAKVMTVTASVVLTLDGEDYTFSMDITLDVQDASKLVYIGIDASHYNEYVAGNYSDSMGNFGNLAAEYGIRTVELKTSEALIEACSNDKFVALIMTAPSRRLEAAQKDIKVYSAEEIAAIQAFNAKGGTVIMAGWSDHYEYYPDALTMTAEQHMAATQNAVLEALGSSIRISDDATYDDVYSNIDGCDAWRLYFNTYNFDNFLVDGVEVGEGDNAYNSLYTEKFSHYGGASIYTVDGTLPETVSPVVYAHNTTYSVDVDKDGLGGSNVPKYAYAEGDERLLIMASEQLEGKGLIIVSGAAFMSNFEVQATIEDSGSEKNYSNYRICENLLAYLNPTVVTPIAEVQAEAEEGVKYTIEGVVTSNASGYDADTAFFDCIYVQDETAGINAFPVAGSYKIGDIVRITGTTSSYQGERQIAVTSIEKIGETDPVEPTTVTADQLENQGYLGTLVKIEGTATRIEYANGLIQTIMVKDDSGKEARVFIDGYITTAKDVENAEVGCHVVAIGLASYDNTFVLEDGTPVYQRIRIRDRADVVCTESEEPDEPVTPSKPSKPTPAPVGPAPSEPVTPVEPVDPVTPAEPALPFIDVPENAWYFKDVAYVYENGIMNGISDELFDPNAPLTRAMLVTILYRMAPTTEVDGETAVTFTDVNLGSWYGEAMVWAARAGIVTGYDASTFGPNDPVTREQLATILFRYAVYCGMDAVTLAEHLGGYSDTDDISGFAVAAMNWAVGQGLVNGVDGALLPKAEASRAQVAAIIHRFLENVSF